MERNYVTVTLCINYAFKRLSVLTHEIQQQIPCHPSCRPVHLHQTVADPTTNIATNHWQTQKKNNFLHSVHGGYHTTLGYNVIHDVFVLFTFAYAKLCFQTFISAAVGAKLQLGPSCRLPTASPGRWIGGRPPDMVASCDLSG